MPGARQPQPMQEHYPAAGFGVQTLPDGTRALVVNVPLPRKVMVFPLDNETAEALGKKLAAPSVVRANGRTLT